MAKVTGSKVFSIDVRARDIEGWPDRQSHALTIHVPHTNRIYKGLDLSLLRPDLEPDVLIDAERLQQDGVAMPQSDFYGDFFLAPGAVPPMLGQPVAIGIWHDYERFRAARKKLQFVDSIFLWGEAAGSSARAPYGAARYVRIGGDDPRGADRFSPMKVLVVWPQTDDRGVHWPGPDDAAFGDAMRHSADLRAKMEDPPEGWRVFARNYHSQSVDPAAMEVERRGPACQSRPRPACWCTASKR